MKLQGRAIRKVMTVFFCQCRIFFRTTPRVRFFHSISPCAKNFAPQPPITFLMVCPLPHMSKLPFNNFFFFYFFNQPVPGSWEYHRCKSLCSDLLYEQKSLPLSANPGKFYLEGDVLGAGSHFPRLFAQKVRPKILRTRGRGGRREAKWDSRSQRTSL